MLGKGVKMSWAIFGGAATVLAAAGLATGIGIEANKDSLRNQRISDLNENIRLADEITQDINVRPPSGFIN